MSSRHLSNGEQGITSIMVEKREKRFLDLQTWWLCSFQKSYKHGKTVHFGDLSIAK